MSDVHPAPVPEAATLTAAPLVCGIDVPHTDPAAVHPAGDLLKEFSLIAGALDLTSVASQGGVDRPGWNISDAGVETSQTGCCYWVQMDISATLARGGRVPLRAVLSCLNAARLQVSAGTAGTWSAIAALCPPLTPASMSTDDQLSELARIPRETATKGEQLSVSLRGDFPANEAMHQFATFGVPNWGRDFLHGFETPTPGQAAWPFPAKKWATFMSQHHPTVTALGTIDDDTVESAAWVLALLEALTTSDSSARKQNRVLTATRLPS